MKPTLRNAFTAMLLAGTSLAMAVPVLAQDTAAPVTPPAAMGGGQMMGRHMMDDMRGPMFDFARYDADGDGKVTQDEIRAARAAEATALDANADGKISAEELVAQEMATVQAGIEARVKARVAAQDSDGDGLLSAAELADRPMPMMVFERMDADNDGAISAEEMTAAKDRMQDRMGERMGNRGGTDGAAGKGGRMGDCDSKGRKGGRGGDDQGWMQRFHRN